MKSLDNILEWTYEDLKELPKEESDSYEYKSSKIQLDDLKHKISIAASSFWNSGGGIFIAGVNNNGEIDGGIPKAKGRQGIRDWADQAIKITEPLGNYEIAIIEHNANAPEISEGNIILIIKFFESHLLPHMAYDKKYYIRAGAHSDGATHFQVEVLRSFKHYTKPDVRCIMRQKPTNPDVDELGIISLNDSVALNLTINLEPIPEIITKQMFPLKITIYR